MALYGYWDRVLRVNLTTGQVSEHSMGESFWRQHLGGRGLIAHVLLTETRPGIDPLGPENKLIFAAGTLTGIAVPGAGRHSVGARSPLTGGFGESEAGGYWGAELRHAGYDALIIEGQADRPVYLLVTEDRVELRDAAHLWGKITGEVEDILRAELGDRFLRVAQVGPAGENLVRFACIVNDLNEVAGRTGLGAVMGAKKLKAIAVRGKQKVPQADPSAAQETAKWTSATMMEKHPILHEYGTGARMLGKHLEGHLIVRNWRDGQFDAVERIDARAIARTYRVAMDGCYACSVRCKKRVRIDGTEVDPRYGGPEYETLGAIGTNLAIDDLVALCKANVRLNYLGMDSISCGGTIGWAIECFEQGILSEAEVGRPLAWGDGQLLNDLIEDIAYRRGFGDLLAEGALRAARQLGRDSERYVVHVKGLEMAMHDPRAMPEMLRNYPVTPTGGDHTGAAMRTTALRNTIGLCQFLAYDDDRVLALVRGATGWDLDQDELTTIYRRGVTLARLYNLREGFTAADDRLPDRLHESHRSGPLAGKVLPREAVSEVVREYYRQQGWDERTGVPTAATLRELGLDPALYAPTLAVGERAGA